jgi:hypothetical protein
LKELIISDNDLSGPNICKLQILLWNNRALRKLDFENCNLGREAAQAIGEGFYKNQTISSINLSGNFLPASCMESWSSSQCLGLFTLKSLDLSNNPQLGDLSVLQVLHGLKNKIKTNGKVE